MNKFLLVGLGNKGSTYKLTRHNIGFEILDELAKEDQQVFSSQKLAYYGVKKYKGKLIYLIKPTTYMNQSGEAVKYWQNKLKIKADRLLVLMDDLSLPFGSLRLKPDGSAGGHNGLKSIITAVGHQKFARLRFGVGANFSKGKQAEYVLSSFSMEEKEQLPEKIKLATQVCLSFCFHGLTATMNQYNRKKKS